MRSSVRSRATQLATGQEILSLCRLQATSSSPAAITLPQLQLENRTARNISQGAPRHTALPSLKEIDEQAAYPHAAVLVVLL